MLYLKAANAWEVWDQNGVFFPWREYEHFWQEHHRVGDAIHIVDAAALPTFDAALAELENRPDLHFLYAQLEGRSQPLHFIEAGYYDSNTLFGNPECVNPLYRIGHRPRLWFYRPVASPWLRQLKSKIPARLWMTLTRVAARLLRRGTFS